MLGYIVAATAFLVVLDSVADTFVQQCLSLFFDVLCPNFKCSCALQADTLICTYSTIQHGKKIHAKVACLSVGVLTRKHYRCLSQDLFVFSHSQW